MVVDFWRDSNDAALAAVETPGTLHVFGPRRNLAFLQRGQYLYLRLPSGRRLVYPAPAIVMRPTPWGEERPAVAFSSVNPLTKQWGRWQLYGGLIVENIVQATARDLLADSMQRLEANGYPVVMHTHDEAVVEVPAGTVSEHDVYRTMAELPSWASGLPIKVEGWRGERYRK
jgi:DNA polymerase